MTEVTKGLTLETIFGVFLELPKRLTEVETQLSKISTLTAPVQDQWLNLTELCNYHPDKPTKPTVYGWVSSGSIPNYKDGKRLRFLKSEIDAWLKSGKKKTATEIAAEASTYLSNKKSLRS